MYKKATDPKRSVKKELTITVSSGFVILGILTMFVTFNSTSMVGADQLLLPQLTSGFGCTAWGLLECLDPDKSETGKVLSFAVLGCALVLALLAVHTIGMSI